LAKEPPTKKIKTNNGEESHNGVAKTQDYIQSRAENGSHSDGKKITTDTPTKENNGIHSNNVMEQKLQEKNGFHKPEDSQNGKIPTKSDEQERDATTEGVYNETRNTTLTLKMPSEAKIDIEAKKGFVEKIVGAQLVQDLIQNNHLVEEIKPWSISDDTEQEKLQQEKKLQLEQLHSYEETLSVKRKRDEWDKALDKGRVKKVKSKNDQASQANPFQQVAKLGKKSSRGRMKKNIRPKTEKKKRT